MDKRAPNNASYYSHPDIYKYVPTKPLYMLIKVEVDKEIVCIIRIKQRSMPITIVTEWSTHLLTGTILMMNNTHT